MSDGYSNSKKTDDIREDVCGQGMRIVHSLNEFVESFLDAKREAAASFGTNTILLEKYITRPRHIEVQHGNIMHLYERDCSVQRRHQKIIKEAPAPNVWSDFRAHLGQATVSAAKGESVLADSGTEQLEFIVLSKRTGDPKYQQKAENVITHINKTFPDDGLLPIYIDPRSGRTAYSPITFGAMGDSFYEYLLKAWIQGNKTPAIKLYRVL